MGISDNKKFIILQEDDKGYSFNNKKPSGYTKIEDKDGKFKIFYFVQNIDSENTYGLVLIINNDSKIEVVSIGEVKADSNGKIEMSYDFDEELLNSVCGSGISIKNSNGEIKFPLSGFIPKKKVFNWKVSQSRLIKNRPFRKDVLSFDKKRDSSKKTEIKSKIKDGEIEDMITIANDGYEENKIYINHEENLIDRDNKDCEAKDHKEEISNDDSKILDNDESKDDNNTLENNTPPKEDSRPCLPNEDFQKDEDEEGKESKFKNGGSSLMKKYHRMNNEGFRRENMNAYERYENKIKHKIDKTKSSCEKAKEHIEALKKLIVKDDGKIEKLIQSLFPNIFKNKRSMIEDYDYRFFLNILNEYDEMNSLNQEGYVFFKVYVDNFSQFQNMKKIDNIKYGVVYYPMISMYPYFKDNGYFIVGLNYDEGKNISNLVYGVEVREGMEEDFPYDGKTGFNKYIYDYGSSKGYHIMEYDYKGFEVK